MERESLQEILWYPVLKKQQLLSTIFSFTEVDLTKDNSFPRKTFGRPFLNARYLSLR